jgi:hypothetical protein
MAKVKNEEATLTYKDKTYKISELSEEAQKQLVNVRITESEIRRLQMQLAITQTAHSAYEQALLAALPA